MQNTTKKQTVIYGSKVAYWTYNPKQTKTIVMVHGFRGTHHGLEAIVKDLPEYKIIIPDLPGFGESTPMHDRLHNIKGYSAFVQTFIKQLNIDRPNLLGHSFGSIVAADVAAHGALLINKLVLVNAIASPALKGPKQLFTHFARFYYFLGKKLPEKPGHALLASPVTTLSMSVLLAKTKDKKLRKRIHHNHLQYFSTFQNRQVLIEAFEASITATAADYAEQIVMPTLLIAGKVDDIAPPKGQFALEKKIPNAKLVILPKVGHLVHYEKPAEAAMAIKKFLD